MRKIARVAIPALMVFSAAILAVAPVAAKSDPSCSERYGRYGYSYAYCQHDLYGRSSPADRYQGRERELQRQEVGPIAQLQDSDGGRAEVKLDVPEGNGDTPGAKTSSYDTPLMPSVR